MRCHRRHGQQVGRLARVLQAPHEALALRWMREKARASAATAVSLRVARARAGGGAGARPATLLLDATSSDPSAATETERIGTPSAGTSSCMHWLAVKSQILMLPFWSPEISSPWPRTPPGAEREDSCSAAGVRA